jgi:hypothetical protein
MGISKIIKRIDSFQKATNSSRYELFFRGQKANDKLIPRLLRDEYASYKENHLYCDSWVMGNNEFINSRNSWEILAKMQHYGIPTRLLDWTGSLIAGIYFSISDCIDCKSRCKGSNPKREGCRGNPTLWVLNSRIMHQDCYPELRVLSFTIGIDDISDYSDVFIKLKNKDWPYRKAPIFLEVPWTNNRITSQRGYFTFHSDDEDNPTRALEEVLKDSKSLLRIEIDPELKNELVDEYRVMGISEFDIYPDLSSIGRHTVRSFKEV